MENTAKVMTIKDWVITIFITAIPLVGFIMLFVWAFGEGTNPNKSNWAKGTLLIILIGVILYFILAVAVFLVGAAFVGL